MLKSFHWIAVLTAASILCIAETALTRPLTVGDKYPVVPTSNTDQLVCYMQTADDRTLNLSSLCGKKPSVQPQVAISNVIRNGDYMSGRVINNTGKTVYQAMVNFEIISKDGSEIEKGSIYTDQQTLSPGQTGTFQTFMPSGLNVRTTSVEWDE
jgi:hypothetical protein